MGLEFRAWGLRRFRDWGWCLGFREVKASGLGSGGGSLYETAFAW